VTEPTGDGGAAVAAVVAAGLRDVPDFPQPGIVFKDIAPLLADAGAFRAATEALADHARAVGSLDLVAGIEARGFLVGGALAHALGTGLVAVRKVGKLPPPTVRRSYQLEYGSAEIEVPVGVLDGKRVFLVDDVLATGGTMRAAAELLGQAGASVTGLGVLLELGFLDGRAQLADVAALHSLLRV
jgi:adenine phosphoribosyltransferase